MAKAQFNRDEVIEKAIALFWQNGFAGSSMEKVVKVTGLKPGSIYHAFGSKEGLYREALDAYAEKSLALIRRSIEAAPDLGQGIVGILEKNIEESIGKDYCACFLIKTQLELSAHPLHLLAAAKLGQIEGLYESYLETAFGQPLARQRAASLMLHIFGMRVYGYRQGATPRLRQGLKAGLPWLPWPTEDTP